MSGEVTLRWMPPACSPNARVHWAVKAKSAKRYKLDCWALAREAGLSVDWDGPVHLWITFHKPSRRAMDDDNLIASFKAGRDGLAMALGIDDKRFVTHPMIADQVGGMVKVRLSKDPA